MSRLKKILLLYYTIFTIFIVLFDVTSINQVENPDILMQMYRTDIILVVLTGLAWCLYALNDVNRNKEEFKDGN